MRSHSYTPQHWARYFSDIGLPKDLRKAYMSYVWRMYRADLPVIFEFEHLARLLGRTNAYLASAVNAPNYHYRIFEIPKRSGGMRQIEAPFPALLDCQRWVLANILKKCEIHPNAHGYVKGRSILTNAKKHLGKKEVLKLDLTNFFPSIKKRRVIDIFRKLGYPRNISFYLASVCCYDGRLAQGAATSPIISNIIAKRLDHRLASLAETRRLGYTRYADDLTFSGKGLSRGLVNLVSQIACEEGFALNNKKTRLLKSSQNKIVTGIIINGNTPKLPRKYKRKIRQEVYYIRKFGYISHVGKRKISDPLYIDTLFGKISYWKWVEPDNIFAENAIGLLTEYMEERRISNFEY